MHTSNNTVLIFGGSGAIGSSLIQTYLEEGWNVVSVSRKKVEEGITNDSYQHVYWEPNQAPGTLAHGLSDKIKAIVWAQGVNISDDISTYNRTAYEDIFNVNVTYILTSLHELLTSECLANSCRLVVISSIWQEIGRNRKLAYMVSKSALRGLVQSVAADIGPEGHLVNALMPGVLNTPMTRTALSSDQIAMVTAQTPIKRLATVQDVCSLTYFLTSSTNNGITGQFICVDGGFSDIRFFP